MGPWEMGMSIQAATVLGVSPPSFSCLIHITTLLSQKQSPFLETRSLRLREVVTQSRFELLTP